jgi:hypothetical protein
MQSQLVSFLNHSALGNRRLPGQKQFAVRPVREFLESRRQPRFKLAVDIVIHSRSSGVLKGYTVDISESGVSAMLRVDLPVGDIVELDFALPSGAVTIYAVVRQRSAFRYGFQFLESTAGNKAIRHTCRQFAVESMVSPDHH